MNTIHPKYRPLLVDPEDLERPEEEEKKERTPHGQGKRALKKLRAKRKAINKAARASRRKNRLRG